MRIGLRGHTGFAVVSFAATATVAVIAIVAVALGTMHGCAQRRESPRTLAADPASERHPPAGPVVGGEGLYGAHAWLGIPYAEPPIGDLRWRAPRPLAPWGPLREAIRSGGPCTQYASPLGGVENAPPDTPVGNEDCLTLDVWAPRFTADRVPQAAARLPVLVWIHGGGNSIGQTASYVGGNLATTHNVVVVAIQYRLGPFGWLRHASLRASAADAEEASGNFGTLDQIRALEWVRDNISAFGGNPDDVTIFGESAGGQNVYMLLLASRARGLFQRAIAQSGGVWTSTPSQAEAFATDPEPGAAQSSNEILVRLLVRDGLASTPVAARERLTSMRDDEIAAYLRGKSARDFLTAYTPIPSAGMIDHPRVFSDGTVLPAGDPIDHLRTPGEHAAVPLVTGTTRDETKLFLFGDPARIRKRLWLFPRFVDEPRYLASAEHQSRMWKANGADEPARALQAAGDAGVWVYRFDWDEEPTVFGSDLSAMLGAAHGFDIPFVFGHFDFGRSGRYLFDDAGAAGRDALSRAMMSYWAEFARSGNPGRGRAGNLPEWTAWGEPPESRTLVLDTPAGGGIRMTPIEETREAVIASVASDPRLPEPRDRCRVLHELAERSRGFSKEEYTAKASTFGCAAFPYEQYPWSG